MMVVPGALDQLTHTIQVLQQLQRLLPIEATLSDVADLLASLQANNGSDVLLEDVIQHLVGEHIAAQIAPRRALRRRDQMKQEVAALERANKQCEYILTH
jgi:hypothetical protein